MLKLSLLLYSSLLISTACLESIYTFSVTSIEGDNKPLSMYTEKKILIITLPTIQNSSNDSLLHSIDSLGIANLESLVIIAVPSYEDGFTLANKNDLKLWYRSILNPTIVVTDGMYTRKTSGTQQAPLFRWLTDKDKNGHFNQDVTGPRNKFFVWVNGDLSSVLGEQTRLGGITMRDLLLGQ